MLMKKGFLIGGVLLTVGLALQATAGPVCWDSLAYPVNLTVLIAFLVLLVAAWLLRNKVYLFSWMMHLGAAVPALIYALALTILMGLTPQRNDGAGIPWLSQMRSFWPFVLIYAWMMTIAGLATLNHLLRFQVREIPFLLNHLGLFLALVCGALGASDTQRLHMTVREGETENRAVDETGIVHELDFSMELHDFMMEEYPARPGTGMRMPKRFASDVTVHTKEGEAIPAVIDVNKPLKMGGWIVYQYDYDEQMGARSEISVFELVREPWQPFVRAGIWMMLAGALCLIGMKYVPKRKWVLLAAVLLTGLFTFLTVTRMGPSAQSMPPALQSPWFIPHLIVYMAGYAMLATATAMAAYRLLRYRVKPGMTKGQPGMDMIDNLVYAGLAFLTFGMLFGALWAKEVWGGFWGWDPKETWAAITWLCYLLYIHFRRAHPREPRGALILLLLAFLCLQMCWWGINYLPAARDFSVHTY